MMIAAMWHLVFFLANYYLDICSNTIKDTVNCKYMLIMIHLSFSAVYCKHVIKIHSYCVLNTSLFHQAISKLATRHAALSERDSVHVSYIYVPC